MCYKNCPKGCDCDCCLGASSVSECAYCGNDGEDD